MRSNRRARLDPDEVRARKGGAAAVGGGAGIIGIRAGRGSGPGSEAVRQELQADTFAADQL